MTITVSSDPLHTVHLSRDESDEFLEMIKDSESLAEQLPKNMTPARQSVLEKLTGLYEKGDEITIAFHNAELTTKGV